MPETRVFIRGEIDLATAPDLRVDLRRVLHATHDDIGVDLYDVTFLDASGIAVLVAACRETEAAGRGFRVINASAWFIRVFNIVGVAELLHAETVGAARVRAGEC